MCIKELAKTTNATQECDSVGLINMSSSPSHTEGWGRSETGTMNEDFLRGARSQQI